MHTVYALQCFVVVIHWLIFPYPSGLLHWHCGNLTIASVPAKQPWWIWINTSCEFIMNDCITTTKQSTTQPCAYFLGYTVHPTVPVGCNYLSLPLIPASDTTHLRITHWTKADDTSVSLIHPSSNIVFYLSTLYRKSHPRHHFLNFPESPQQFRSSRLR